MSDNSVLTALRMRDQAERLACKKEEGMRDIRTVCDQCGKTIHAQSTHYTLIPMGVVIVNDSDSGERDFCSRPCIAKWAAKYLKADTE